LCEVFHKYFCEDRILGLHFVCACIQYRYMTNELSTQQVADGLGVRKITLIQWVRRGLLQPKPRVVQMGGLRLWFWSQADVRRAGELAGRMRDKRKKEHTT
jgi:hypothetical protein